MLRFVNTFSRNKILHLLLIFGISFVDCLRIIFPSAYVIKLNK